jgi:hypothetical protein
MLAYLRICLNLDGSSPAELDNAIYIVLSAFSNDILMDDDISDSLLHDSDIGGGRNVNNKRCHTTSATSFSTSSKGRSSARSTVDDEEAESAIDELIMAGKELAVQQNICTISALAQLAQESLDRGASSSTKKSKVNLQGFMVGKSGLPVDCNKQLHHQLPKALCKRILEMESLRNRISREEDHMHRE